uniref:Uncharacterized protein n=1 Tax=Tardiphaga robiniae TaxID=943830 RepID=A0A120MG08_9BRAD|nr:hypothetical protein PROKKA_00572 [Tardiphaga robiniae]
MLFLVISNPRADRPSDMAAARQSFWPWMAGYQASGSASIFIPCRPRRRGGVQGRE